MIAPVPYTTLFRSDRQVGAAGVAELRRAEYRRGRALDRRVGRATGDRRGGAVQHRDGLSAGGRIVVREAGVTGAFGLAVLIAADRYGFVGEGDRQVGAAGVAEL